MANKYAKKVSVPSLSEIQSERKRIRRGTYYRQALRGTISVLLVVAAVAVLITTQFLPILQISGDSMSPTLEHDEIVVLLKTKKFERGDLIGFYYQGKILLKRVIALPEDEVAIDADGTVYEGEFEDGFLVEGKITFADGEVWEGKFEDGKFVEGKKTFADGTVLEGKFEDDVLDDVASLTLM